ncbi:MAG TPA: hypothetical protein VLA75_04505, partial [Thermoanaerobaculia bacterium]|nr:hypothetical protein [Thermoanaerobaculia bacterium]
CAAALAAAGGTPPAWAEAPAAAPSCADCCKLPCIEAQLFEAKQMQENYRQLAKQKNLTQAAYEEYEKAAAHGAALSKQAALGRNPDCAWYTPNGTDAIEMREFQFAGFRAERDAKGRITGWDYTMKANPETCGLNAKAVSLFPRIVSCSAIAEATIAHEERHQSDCEARKRAGKKVTLAELALGEAAAYEVEIQRLQAARIEAAQACKQRSCRKDEQPHEPWEVTARLLGTDIDKLLGLDKKPASKSPLARKGAGR